MRSHLGILAVVAFLILASCDATSTPAGKASPLSTSSPSSSALARPDEARAVIGALAKAGIKAELVGSSKFDWVFGDTLSRSAVFGGIIDRTQFSADVLFLDAPVDGITICTHEPPPGEWTFTVSVRGLPRVLGSGSVTGGATARMYFAVNERFFMMTSDSRVRDVLRLPLALSVPLCREPATLPVLPWEREVMDAFDAGGVDIRLIGASKFETFLGDRRDARVFIKTAGQGGAGAEVLFLTTPLRELRMCSAPSSPGFTSWTVVVDGKTVPGVEGSQTLYPLFGPRFFVLASDADSAKALARGLGLSAPTC